MLAIIYIFALWIVGGHDPMTRGTSIAPSTSLMIDVTKKIDNMTKMKPFAQVLKEFEHVHGDRYIYTDVKREDYHGRNSVVSVICREHGVFSIRVSNHLLGQGCSECAKIQRRLSNTGNVRNRTRLIYGVGINDYEGSIKFNHVHIKSYHTWVQMLKRCYSEEFLERAPTYKGCSVTEEWQRFSVFKKWFDENYIKDYALDKDILVKGNKVYSPQTCCFVPSEINALLIKSDAKRGNTPIGVHQRQMMRGYKYTAYLNVRGERRHLGTYNTPKEAFAKYKEAKEANIKEMSTEYYNDGKITERVYNALTNYKVEITD